MIFTSGKKYDIYLLIFINSLNIGVVTQLKFHVKCDFEQDKKVIHVYVFPISRVHPIILSIWDTYVKTRILFRLQTSLIFFNQFYFVIVWQC